MCKTVLFISHEISRTGAPIMVLQAVKALRKAGFLITVFTYKDGPLKEEFQKEGIKVFVSKSNINEKSDILLAYGKSFDLVIINTIVCTGAIKTFLNQEVPVFWWIHEGRTFIPGIKVYLPEKLSRNIHIFCISYYTKKLLLQLGATYEANVLYNGVEEIPYNENQHIVNNRKMFICVGSIEERKGQDLILKAIDKLIREGINDLEFVFVGQIISISIKEKIEEYCRKYSFVKLYPVMPRDELLMLMASSTALLAPSRDDPAPLVVSEAMMLNKPVVVSNHVGIADLIIDGKNGFVIENENIEALTAKILWIRNNFQEAKNIGRRGREVYNEYFSIEKFEEKYTATVNSLINNINSNDIEYYEQSLSDALNELFENTIKIEAECTVQRQQINDLVNLNHSIQNTVFFKLCRLLTWGPRNE